MCQKSTHRTKALFKTQYCRAQTALNTFTFPPSSLCQSRGQLSPIFLCHWAVDGQVTELPRFLQILLTYCPHFRTTNQCFSFQFHRQSRQGTDFYK
jgi:hypothetical protein